MNSSASPVATERRSRDSDDDESCDSHSNRFSPKQIAKDNCDIGDVDQLFGFDWSSSGHAAAKRLPAGAKNGRARGWTAMKSSSGSSTESSDDEGGAANRGGPGWGLSKAAPPAKPSDTVGRCDVFSGEAATVDPCPRSSFAGSEAAGAESRIPARSNRFAAVLARVAANEQSLEGDDRGQTTGEAAAASRTAQRTASAMNRDRQCFIIDPIIIRSSSVDAVLSRMSAEEIMLASAKPKRPLPQTLPQQLDMPLSLRCDFCQKFDSVCSTCHRKWKEVLEKRSQDFALRNFSRLQEERKKSILFMSVSHGFGPFVAMQAWYDKEKCRDWCSAFYPLDSADRDLQEVMRAAGSVYPLHVAIAYGNAEAAKALLEIPRVFIRKSSRRVDPLEFLDDPLSDKWATSIGENIIFRTHQLSEKAKQARAAKDWEGAERIYAELLALKADSEEAWCGRAKMLYDRGEFGKCMQLCEKMISEEITVDWNSLRVGTIEALHLLAVRDFHTMHHNDPRSGVLKECGCVITDKVRLSMRRLSMSLIIDYIFPFCDGEALWGVHRCSKMPLLRSAAEKSTVLLPAKHINGLFAALPGYDDVCQQFFAVMPSSQGPKAVVGPDVKPLGVSVVAMADYGMFLVKASVVGSNPRAGAAGASASPGQGALGSAMSFLGLSRKAKKSGASDGASADVDAGPKWSGAVLVFSKQFRVNRTSPEEPWRAHETSEWDLDDSAKVELEAGFAL